MKGRRVAHRGEIRDAGDYYGPDKGECTGGSPAVWFLLPNARDEKTHGAGRSMRHVVSPPHTFTEEPDGSLTIMNSIGAMPHWHGFLIKGDWRDEA
jgi:hypothetical protein